MIRRTSLIYKEIHRLGPLSNQELSELLVLSPGGITQILQPLVAEGLVQELSPEQYRMGEDLGPRKRRKTTWQPNPEYGYAIVGLVRDERIAFYRVSFHLGSQEHFLGEIVLDLTSPIIPQITSSIQNYRKTFDLPLRAIGFAVSGRVEGSTNRVLFSNNLGYLVDLDLAGGVERALGVPTLVVNDSYALSVGERYTGQARNVLHFLTLFVDEGVGMGLVIDGKPYQGFENLAGEPGQYLLSPKGGSTLESLVSQDVIARKLGIPVKDRDRTYEGLQTLVENNDPRGMKVLNEISQTLGLLCTNLLLLLSPEILFLTGPLGDVGTPLESAIRREIQTYAPAERAGAMADRFVVRQDWKKRMILGTGLAAFEAHLNRKDQLEPNPRTGHTT
ncbi:MAG: ROK family transcriptional regulator [Spirochaetales bacterium]|nr:ROK family transcriptional regulator [Spirochaetales bacterium]